MPKENTVPMNGGPAPDAAPPRSMRATIDASPSARGGPRTPSMPAPDPDRAPVPSSPDPAHALRVAELFREHNRALVAFLRSRLDSLADAQEVAQEAYVRLVTLERPETIDSLRAYLFRIATNLVRDRWRRKDHQPSPEPDELANATHSPNLDTSIDVRAALQSLKPRERELLWLAYVEGMSHTEIAAATGLQSLSVRLLLYRARKKAAALLNPNGSPQ